MNRDWKYDFDEALQTPWYQPGATLGDQKEKQLYPREWTFSFNPSKRFESLFAGYLAPLTFSVNSALKLDLQRYTYSSLTFGLSLTFSIKKFLDFTIGVSSVNNVIYRYIQDLPIFDKTIRDEIKDKTHDWAGYEKNFFIDLLNSFRFDDEALRIKSGFNMERLNFKAVHHLGDWDATLEVSLVPKLDNSAASQADWEYKFEPTISFYVQWIPIKELETGVDYKDKNFSKRVVNK
jgi:hypothetical protein